MSIKARKGFALLSAAIVCGILLAGCGDAEPAASAPGARDNGPDNSVIAYVGSNIFDSSLDPVKGAMSHGYSFTNAALLKVTPSSEYAGDMAADWSVSDDALVYTFKLREGVRFGDGSDLTARDVVFTYETVKANQAQNENADLTRLDSVAAQGDHTVVFTLTEPYSPFLDTTAMLGIVPSDSYDSAAFDTHPIGTGPWKVVQYDANQQIIVAPNEYYYEGAPSIGRITLVNMDNDSALPAARSGQLDAVMVSPHHADQAIAGMTMTKLETMDIRQVSLPVRPEAEKGGVLYGNNVTSDIAVRQALAIGIDRRLIIENALSGIGKPAVGFTGNLVWADTGGSFEDNRKDEAAALLEKAGWTDTDGDGVREKGLISCEFSVYAAEDRYALAAALAEDAAKLGIKINPHSASWDEISKNMDTSGVVWGWGQYSPTVLAALFDSRYAYSDGYNNAAAYSNPQVDALIEKALSQSDREAAVTYWRQVQAQANKDFPYLYITNIEHCYFISDRLDISAGTQIPHPHGHGAPIICNMKDWTLK